MREREIISRFFDFASDASVLTGVGDDAAVLRPPSGESLVVSTDSLNAGVHFFADISPFLLARKAAAVSLSDMAAMGARPLWMFVALSTAHNSDWIESFAAGLKSSAAQFNYTVAGGDLCRADSVSVTTTAIGAVGKPLLRSGAKVGEQVWLSGATGEAALAVHHRKHGEKELGFKLSDIHLTQVNNKLQDPTPRLDMGLQLSTLASSAIDLSDGLIAAASEIAIQSGCGMTIHANALPVAESLESLPEKLQLQLMLSGGDDYELLFCAPSNQHDAVKCLGAYCIGEVIAGSGVSVVGADLDGAGYEHDFGR